MRARTRQESADVDATGDARTVAEFAAQMMPMLVRALSDLEDADPSKATAEAELSLMRRLLTEAASVRPAD